MIMWDGFAAPPRDDFSDLSAAPDVRSDSRHGIECGAGRVTAAITLGVDVCVD